MGDAEALTPLERLNALPQPEAVALVLSCAGSRRVAEGVVAARPFATLDDLLRIADFAWGEADAADVIEATKHHPRIGANLDALRAKYENLHWSAGEQAGAARASEETLVALRDANVAYEHRFGFIFIVCATGKSADEMLALCEERLENPVDDEWLVAREELRKITRLRLQKT